MTTKPVYFDRRFKISPDEYAKKLAESTTIYVGNLSFYTTEDQIYEVMSRAGLIKRIIMGLNRFDNTPCGFSFVEYYTRNDAENAYYNLNGTVIDDRICRCDIDIGFVEGKQLGRGKSGGQLRDEFRKDFDEGRGGPAKPNSQAFIPRKFNN